MAGTRLRRGLEVPQPDLQPRTERLTEEELTTLGAGALRLLADTLAACVAAGRSAATDPEADAVTLWVCLHGLAHQQAVTRIFPWPAESIADAIVSRVARLDEACGDAMDPAATTLCTNPVGSAQPSPSANLQEPQVP
ncbi:TetR-like C-terminal domain-containing protein [Streptomyces sp. NPDC006552]|uniref:TetR-like C-terminal domain-containing protein n=1 Tax=Streptomyces sp. NPDC006552 TaxID=3157179 RepID=UPI0033A4F49D